MDHVRMYFSAISKRQKYYFGYMSLLMVFLICVCFIVLRPIVLCDRLGGNVGSIRSEELLVLGEHEAI